MSSKMLSFSSSSLVINEIYVKRQQEFTVALEKVIKSVTKDKIIQQMLTDNNSSNFIVKRFEEIFYNLLNDSREAFIDKLLKKIQKYENLFCEEYGEMVTVLGNKSLTVSDSENICFAERMNHIHVLLEEIKTLQEEIANLKLQNTEKEDLITDLRNSHKIKLFKDNFSNDTPHFYAEIDATQLNERVKIVSKDCKAIKGSVNKLKEQMDKIMIEANKTAKSALRAMQIKNKQMERRMIEEKSNDETFQRKYKEELAQMQHEIVTKQMEIYETNENLLKSNKEIDDLKQKNKNAKDLIEEMKKQQNELKKENKTIKEENIIVVETNDKLENNNSKLQKEITKIKTINLKLENQINKQKQELEEHKNTNKEAVKIIKHLQAKNKTLRKELEVWKHSNEELESDLKSKVNEFSSLKEKFNLAVSKIRELNRETSKLSIEAGKTNDLEKQLEIKESQIKETNEKLNETLNELEETKNAGNNITQQLQSELNSLKREMRSIKKENEEIIKTQSKQIEELKNENNDMSITLKESKKKMREENNKLKDEKNKVIKELGTYKNDLQQKIQSLNKIQMTLQEAQLNYTETKTNLEETRKELKEKNKDLEEVNETNEKLVENKDDFLRLQGVTKMLTLQNDELASKLKKLRKQNTKLRQENGQLRKSFENGCNDYESLEETLENTKFELKKAEDAKELYETQNKTLKSAKVDLNSIFVELGVNNIGEALSLIREINRCECIIKSILKTLNLNDKEELVNVISDINNHSLILKKLENQLNTKNIQQKITQLIQERKTISQITNCKKERAIVDSVQNIVDDYDNTKLFITKLIRTFSDKVSPQDIIFPLSHEKCDMLLKFVCSLIAKANNYKENINNLLVKAKVIGYDGDSCLDAALFIARQKEELEKKNSYVLRAQLDDLRTIKHEETLNEISKR